MAKKTKTHKTHGSPSKLSKRIRGPVPDLAPRQEPVRKAIDVF